MIKSVRFQANSDKPKIYHKNTQRYPSVIERPTLSSKEAMRKKYSLPKKAAKLPPLNEIVLCRINSKAHTFQYHSPEPVRLRTKNMWMLWSKRFIRKGRSADYHNKYSLHRFL